MIIFKRTLDKRYVDPAILRHVLEDHVNKDGTANSYISELKLLDMCRKWCRKEYPK